MNEFQSVPAVPVGTSALFGDFREARTEMKCRVCGGFSSAQVCWHCATNPAGQELEELRRAVREYLSEPSCDGRPVRKQMRERLAVLSQYSPNPKLTDPKDSV